MFKMQDDTDESHILTNIHKLPNELIDIIREYIPKKTWIFTNRENYALYHNFLRSSIYNYENYIRDTIRRDNYFVFQQIVAENFKTWWNINSYMYKNMIFKTYLYFTLHYCIENESPNCRNIVLFFLKEHGFDKNLHKKNIVKYIRWKN